MDSVETQLNEMMVAAIQAALDAGMGDGSSVDVIDPRVHVSQHADFQCDAALGMAKALKRSPREIAENINQHIDTNDFIASTTISGPGFINIVLSNKMLGSRLELMNVDDRLGVPLPDKKTVVVDYSAPNVAKEMHVGHLRSTIIGDACVRLLEWLGHSVVRRNHIGDWGTPFGMLIEHLLDIGEEQATKDLQLGDLDTFYRTARQKFDDADAFQKRARARVVALQSGDPETLALWTKLIQLSQSYFISVYERIDVRLDGSEFYGESVYNDSLKPTLEELTKLGLISESDGAACLFPPGFENREKQPLPLIVQKKDGGFGYAATDLAAIRNRIVDLGAERMLYVVGVPQKEHLAMIFAAAKMAGWLKPGTSAEHIGFGSVLGSDGKMFKSRSGKNIKLADLLDEAISRATQTIEQKNPSLTDKERQSVAHDVGIGAVKYADLSSERTRNYVFDFDRMLSFEGNTAPYLQYAYARIQSMLRQVDESEKSSPIIVDHPAERELALLLLRFPDVVSNVAESLLFHRIAGYLFDLASAFSSFYSACPVIGAEDAKSRQSRMALCHVTAKTLHTGLGFLGINTPEKM